MLYLGHDGILADMPGEKQISADDDKLSYVASGSFLLKILDFLGEVWET